MKRTDIVTLISKRADVDSESRTVRFTLSSNTPDRVGDVINQKGWELDNYLANPVVLWGHNDTIPAIGRMENLAVRSGELSGDVKFASREQHEFADTIFKLVAGDVIRTGSVGFLPLEWTYDETRGGFNFEKAELLEYSIVNIPMNPDARKRALKSGIESEELDALCGVECLEIPDYRSTLIEQSAMRRRKAAHGRLAMRAAVSKAILKVRV